jgi:hypothetical protein
MAERMEGMDRHSRSQGAEQMKNLYRALLRRAIFWTADHPVQFILFWLIALFAIPAIEVLIR